MKTLRRFAAVVCWCVCANTSFASEPLLLAVVDAAGTPVADAVVVFPETPQAAPADVAVMDQVGKQFVPYVLTVIRGQRVSFPNSDNIRHHVYSFSKAKIFELKLYRDTPESPVRFDQDGVVVLGCNIHDAMVAYIYVSPEQAFAQTDATGLASIRLAKRPTTVTVWHPALSPNAQAQQTVAIRPEQWQTDAAGVATLHLSLSVVVPPRAVTAAPSDTRQRFKSFMNE